MDVAEPAALGALLRASRRRAGLTQEELAERTGDAVSVRTLRRIENGHTRPYRATLDALATALALDPPAHRQLLAVWRGTAAPALATSLAEPPPLFAAPLVHSPPPTPLVGREHEVAIVTALLGREDVRLLTLTGPGGVGKTRLALHLAQTQATHYRDGIAVVDLTPLRDPALVLPTLAYALGLRDAGPTPLAFRLRAHLQVREMLIVLDNVEQVVEAGPQLTELLATCPQLTILVTSRRPLHVRGEQEVPVPPLDLPVSSSFDDALSDPDLAMLGYNPAVALLVQGAQRVRPTFALTAANVAAVVALCRRLDGLPLAIELAAARLKLLTPATLLTFLEQRLDVLTGGGRDLPERQRSLRATLDWSYDLLSPEAQALLRHLSVTVGGCTLDAAAVLRAVEPKAVYRPNQPVPADVLETAAELADCGLLQSKTGGDEEPDDDFPRLALLETVRGYAEERLRQAGTESAMRQHHAAYYAGLAEAALLSGPEGGRWMARLATEHDNLRAALLWSLEEAQAREAAPGIRAEARNRAVRLASSLANFWWLHGDLSEGRTWLTRVLALERAERQDRTAHEQHAGTWLRFMAGHLARVQGDAALATTLFEACLVRSAAVGDAQGRARALHSLGLVVAEGSALDRAATLHAEALALARMEQDALGIAYILATLADVRRAQGECDDAVALLDESLVLHRQIGNGWGIAQVLARLGDLACDLGAWQRAATLYMESLEVLGSTNTLLGLPAILDGVARVVATHGDPERAAQLVGSAERLRTALGTPMSASEAVAVAETVAALQQELGTARLAEARAIGCAWPHTEAAATAHDLAAAVSAEGGNSDPRRGVHCYQP